MHCAYSERLKMTKNGPNAAGTTVLQIAKGELCWWNLFHAVSYSVCSTVLHFFAYLITVVVSLYYQHPVSVPCTDWTHGLDNCSVWNILMIIYGCFYAWNVFGQDGGQTAMMCTGVCFVLKALTWLGSISFVPTNYIAVAMCSVNSFSHLMSFY